MRLALCSFTPTQLADSTKLIMEKFPESGKYKYVAHRDTPSRSASEMFALDILKVFQSLDSKGSEVEFSCNSISMRTVKVSTMLFSDEEPVIAHKLALMEKSISELLSGQKTLSSLIGEKLDSTPRPSSTAMPPATPSEQGSVQPSKMPSVIPQGNVPLKVQGMNFAGAATRSLLGRAATGRNHLGQPRSKRINSLIVDDDVTVDSDDDNWEVSAEQKRREKLRLRNEERKIQEVNRRNTQEEKKKSKFVLGTGGKLDDKEEDCPGQAAPKHVFVARTAMSTTKETVEGCLEYLAGIKGIATCCTPQERRDSGEAFSLSWRVQVDNADFEKALQP